MKEMPFYESIYDYNHIFSNFIPPSNFLVDFRDISNKISDDLDDE